jgi:hypothetical protein
MQWRDQTLKIFRGPSPQWIEAEFENKKLKEFKYADRPNGFKKIEECK